MSAKDSFQQLRPGPEPCSASAKQLQPYNLTSYAEEFLPRVTTILKVPVVLAETTIQIPVEATIKLASRATEIKRVKKLVILDQVKLVPVDFIRLFTGFETGPTNWFVVTTAKLFVSGHIRKNIEYARAGCVGPLLDQVVDIPFSGFTELNFNRGSRFNENPPIIGISENAEANFLNESTQTVPRLDKAFFQNQVIYNEQPYGELVAANFFELDFSPVLTAPEEAFTTLTEKMVMDLTIKVLQVQQVPVLAQQTALAIQALTPRIGG